MTTYWNYLDNENNQLAIHEAAAMLRDGYTVAFPTETVYGLGADAANSEAVQRIFAAKGRPSDNPLIVHIANRGQLNGLVKRTDTVLNKLMDAFWPGPLTLVLPVIPGSISPLVTAGLTTVGVRIPDHPAALELLKAAGCPVAAPSANSSGKPSPTTASHVKQDLEGKIGGIVDGGATGVGLESTVLQYTGEAIHILRPGGVTAEQIQMILPEIPVLSPMQDRYDAAEIPVSPGTKYTHYAPQGRLQIVQGSTVESVSAWIRQDIANAKLAGERTGVLTYVEHQSLYHSDDGIIADLILPCGSLAEPESIAHGLYAALRRFDEAKVTYILAEACPVQGIGAAIMNRLSKAAGHQVIQI